MAKVLEGDYFIGIIFIDQNQYCTDIIASFPCNAQASTLEGETSGDVKLFNVARPILIKAD